MTIYDDWKLQNAIDERDRLNRYAQAEEDFNDDGIEYNTAEEFEAWFARHGGRDDVD